MEFCDWLKAQRIKNNWSLDKLAEITRCTKSYLWPVEQGVSIPTIVKAEIISKAFGCELWKALQDMAIE